MRKVITYGTFDLFHVGHVNILKRARSLGDHLTVVISSDDFNAVKGKKSVYTYAEREEIVSSIRFVDKVIKEENWDQKRDDIINNDINVFVMGDDWMGKFDDLRDLCEVIYLERTPDISTTQVKNALKK